MSKDNNKKTPKVRFPGFTDDWEQRKLDDVVEFLDTMRKPLEGAKRISGPYPYYGASGIVDYVDGYLFDEELILLSEDGANITDRNYPVCFLASGKYWVNNHAHVLRTKQGNENNFICNSLERKDYTQYNTGMAMPKLNKETCKKIPILCPGFEEQKKIGDYFRSLDNLITLHQRKLEKLKEYKKGMFQKMFPKNGEKVPEVRFPGFTDDWEQRKYAEVIELLSGQDFNPEEYNEDGIGIPYLTGASCIENGCTTAVRWTEKPRCIAEKGDTVLVCKGSGYGTIATVNQEKAHIARQFMALKVKKHALDNRFNYFLLNSVVENIKTDARGLIAGIARDAVLKQEIAIPCLNEQAKIGEYFENLDQLITLHQRKLEMLKEFKKGCLQQMFV